MTVLLSVVARIRVHEGGITRFAFCRSDAHTKAGSPRPCLFLARARAPFDLLIAWFQDWTKIKRYVGFSEPRQSCLTSRARKFMLYPYRRKASALVRLGDPVNKVLGHVGKPSNREAVKKGCFGTFSNLLILYGKSAIEKISCTGFCQSGSRFCIHSTFML